MHPSELKNQALVAAAIAEREGFTATADAFKLLAAACATEAHDLLLTVSGAPTTRLRDSTHGRLRTPEVIH